MGEVIRKKCGRWEFGISAAVQSVPVEEWLRVVRSSDQAERGGMIGHGSVSRAEVPGVGSVVVKQYARGGILRHVQRRWYLRWGKTRSEREFETLQLVRTLGIRAPEPLVWAVNGSFVYQSWLVMREIERAETLAALCKTDEALAVQTTEQLVEQLIMLIRHRIYHLDLHPGNVMRNLDGSLYILDFDKARRFDGGLNQLRDKYIRRWRRAVIKHNLPECLSESFCAKLRRNFETWNETQRAHTS